MDSFNNDILRQIFVYLHPLKLHECKLVNKRWYSLIKKPKTAKRLFFLRYNLLIPKEITYWDQYYPLPGAEKYRSTIECYTDALCNKDRVSGDYFSELGPGKVRKWTPAIQIVDNPPTREYIEKVRSSIPYCEDQAIYSPFFEGFYDYGVLVGLHGDFQFFNREYVKVPKKHLQPFFEGFTKGVRVYGYPTIKKIFTKKMDKMNHNLVDNLSLDDDSVDVRYIADYVIPYHVISTKLPLLENHEILDYIMKHLQPHPIKARVVLCQIAKENKKPGLDEYIHEHYPECAEYLSPIRFWIYRKVKDSYEPNRSRLYQLYHRIILDGDWDIYGDFVNTFYSDRDGRPRQRLIYKPVYQLIADGRLKRLGEIISRLDRLYVTNKEVFFRHCLYAAIRNGKKDLVEYFLSCLKKPKRVFPLPRERIWLEMSSYIDNLNNKFKNNLLF